MKERPILFKDYLAQSARDGSKTETRRLADFASDPVWIGWPCDGDPSWQHPQRRCSAPRAGQVHTHEANGFNWGNASCPYGVPGDRLWIREPHYRYGHWEPVDGVKTKGGRQKWAFVADSEETLFDAPEAFRKGRHSADPSTPAWHRRLARFMPRALARTFLEITETQLERLQAIDKAGAIAEGAVFVDHGLSVYGSQKPGWHMDPAVAAKGADHCLGSARHAFGNLWNAISEDHNDWASNPLVWVVCFKRISREPK